MAITKLPRSGIADNAVNASKIEDGTVAASEISGTVSAAKLNATLDISGKTVTLPNTSVTSGQLAGSIPNAKLANSAITIRGTSRALGTSVTIGIDVDWQSKVTSDGSTVTTMVASQGYFVDNTSAAGIVKLPTSATIGDTIAIKDYAGNFATNALVIQRNGHNIQGVANNHQLETNKASVVLVYVDATKGWLYTDEHNIGDLEGPRFITATGGTITNTGNFRIHAFTGDGNFVVSGIGGSRPADGPSVVDYMVVAGGGAGGAGGSGGGGGGFRESHSDPISGPYTASPLKTPTGITLTATTFPISVGAGGTGGASQNGTAGSNSVFSTITSAGGAGGRGTNAGAGAGSNGGSGSGGVWSTASPAPGNRGAGGSGNTPPVSPPQGNNGGTGFDGISSTNNSGGGGGAGGAGGNACVGTGGDGGAGVTTSISGSAVGRAGGGGGTTCRNWNPPYCGVQGTANPVGGGGNGNRPGGASPNGDPGSTSAGTANTGGGGGGGAYGSSAGSSGGKGIVVIRYKFQ